MKMNFVNISIFILLVFILFVSVYFLCKCFKRRNVCKEEQYEIKNSNYENNNIKENYNNEHDDKDTAIVEYSREIKDNLSRLLNDPKYKLIINNIKYTLEN